MAVDDPGAIEVVGRQLDPDAISGEDADSKTTHLPGHVAEYDAIHVVEFDAEHRVRQSFDNLAFEFDFLFLGHLRRRRKAPLTFQYLGIVAVRVVGILGRPRKATPPGGPLPALTDSLKNEYTKQILRATGVRKASLQQRKTPHYRMPLLEEAGGWMKLKKYEGPEIPASEWENLTYTTYSSDPTTFFAPITSATGEIELKGFWEYGKADIDGVWTPNAEK